MGTHRRQRARSSSYPASAGATTLKTGMTRSGWSGSRQEGGRDPAGPACRSVRRASGDPSVVGGGLRSEPAFGRQEAESFDSRREMPPTIVLRLDDVVSRAREQLGPRLGRLAHRGVNRSGGIAPRGSPEGGRQSLSPPAYDRGSPRRRRDFSGGGQYSRRRKVPHHRRTVSCRNVGKQPATARVLDRVDPNPRRCAHRRRRPQPACERIASDQLAQGDSSAASRLSPESRPCCAARGRGRRRV